jgi:hypothetical protein
MADEYRIYFIARFLGARRCSSAKRRAAFTSLADSDPRHREARTGLVRQHDKLLRMTVHDSTIIPHLYDAVHSTVTIWNLAKLRYRSKNTRYRSMDDIKYQTFDIEGQ